MDDKKEDLVDLSEIDSKLAEKLDRISYRMLDIIKKLAKRMERKFGASRTWRFFRMDEVLLQTVRDVIFAHLRSTPPRVGLYLEPEDNERLADALKSAFDEVTRISCDIAERNNLPLDVVLARNLQSFIMNLSRHYSRVKEKIEKRVG